MTGAAVVLLAEEVHSPAGAAAFAAARTIAGGDVRTLALAAREPAGDLPAMGLLEVAVLPGPGTDDGDTWYNAARALLGDAPPPVVVFAAGPLSDAVAARLAGALGFSPVVDVDALEVHDGVLIIERSAFGGKVLHRLRAVPTGVVLAMVGSGEVIGPPPSSPTHVRHVTPVAGPLTEVANVPAPPVGLQAARVVVAGGRGVGEAGFLQVEKLAGQLDAAVGASRAAVDAGWARPDHQVGLTGQTVAPDVYLAIGISGASQHLAGMSRSHVVLAVNTDRAAPMADAADVAFIGDWHALWPFLEELLSSRNPEGPVVTVMGDGTGWSPRGGTRSDHDGAGPSAKDGSRGRS